MERWCAAGLSGVWGTDVAGRSRRGRAAPCSLPLVGLARRSLNFWPGALYLSFATINLVIGNILLPTTAPTTHKHPRVKTTTPNIAIFSFLIFTNETGWLGVSVCRLAKSPSFTLQGSESVFLWVHINLEPSIRIYHHLWIPPKPSLPTFCRSSTQAGNQLSHSLYFRYSVSRPASTIPKKSRKSHLI